MLLSFIHGNWTAVMDSAAKWIWNKEPLDNPAGVTTETFSKEFTVPGTPTGGVLKIAADNSYKVWINGDLLCEDATEFNYSATDTCIIDAADLLSGENTITFEVKNFAQGGGTQQTNPAGLRYKLDVTSLSCDDVPPPPAQCPVGVELLTNGSFEGNVVTNGSNWDIFPSGTALGWVVSWFNGTDTFGDADRPEIANLEVQKNGLSGWLASAGSQWVELDSDWGGPSSSLSGEPGATTISQNIATIAGEDYTVKFDYSPRPGTAAGENKLEVLVNGVVVATYGPSAGAGNTNWTAHSITFEAVGASTNIAFRDAGTPNDSLGTLLDNVSAKCAVADDEEEEEEEEEPTPTTGTLIVKKTIVGGGEGDTADDFSFKVNGGSPVAFENDGQNDMTVTAGSYTVAEVTASGFTTTYNNCSVEVGVGETETCTITNTKVVHNNDDEDEEEDEEEHESAPQQVSGGNGGGSGGGGGAGGAVVAGLSRDHFHSDLRMVEEMAVAE